MLPLHMNGLKLFPSTSLFHRSNQRKMVLIQLNGGNDGLNTVIPVSQYDRLYRARSTIMVPESKLIALEQDISLHPALVGLKNLYNDGMLGVALAVGYPLPNRSHFRSMDVMTSGSPSDKIWQTGWLGRNLDWQEYPELKHPYAITMGYAVSNTCQGEVSNFSTSLVDPWSLNQLPEALAKSKEHYERHQEEVEYILNTIRQTRNFGQTIHKAASLGKNSTEYPDSDLGQQLKTIAQLISGGLETQVYIANLSGFDTHAEQVMSGSDGKQGKHPELLNDLGRSIQSFMMDLKRQGLDQDVFGLTYSEFGRQIRANESGGTDHGDASALFYFGGAVHATVIGSHPAIDQVVPDQAGLPMAIDIRNIYQTILEQWFQSKQIQDSFPGTGFNNLEIFRSN